MNKNTKESYRESSFQKGNIEFLNIIEDYVKNLHKKICFLENDIKLLNGKLSLREEAIRNYSTARSDLAIDMDKLEEKNKKLIECVKFYASNDTWLCAKNWDFGDLITGEDLEENSQITKRKFVGGKRARQCLKEVGVEK